MSRRINPKIWFVMSIFLFATGLQANAGSVVAWGDNEYGKCNVPEPNTGFVGIAAGYGHSLGLKQDGSIVAWGWNYYGQCNVPSPNTGFVAVAACESHSLGLKADGSIVAWGDNHYGQCNVPEPNIGFVAIAAGFGHGVGLKADGSIVAWGGQYAVNVPEPNTGFVAIAAGGGYIGLKQDGSVVAWGDNRFGQCNVPSPNADFIAIAAGYYHSLGLKADGSVVAWGDNWNGQCNVPEPNTGFVAIAASHKHSLGLKADGSVVAWGYNYWSQCNVPEPNTGFVAVAAGYAHSLGLKDTMLPTVSITSPSNGQTFTTSSITVSGTSSNPGSPSSGVALVEVQVNSGGWQTATGTTSWSCSVNLSPGNNTIEARSKDNAGNYSPIASVNVTYNPGFYGFYEDFSSPELDPAWTVLSNLSPNHYSLTDCPGYLRYYLAPGTHTNSWPVYQIEWDPGYGRYTNPSMVILRHFTGKDWVLRMKVTYNFTQVSNGRQQYTYIILKHSDTEKLVYLQIVRDNDIDWWNRNSLGVNFIDKETGGSIDWGTKLPQEVQDTWYFEITRSGRTVSLLLSQDGQQWFEPFAPVTMDSDPGDEQTITLEGASFFVDTGSYADYDYIYVDRGQAQGGTIVGWGYNNYGQATPPSGDDFTAIAAGWEHSLALRSDGSIVGWGRNDYGRMTPPAGNNFFAIDAGGAYSLALRLDGSIVGWGDNWAGQATPPAGNNYIAIAAGDYHGLALRSDGTIVGWGDNQKGQATPPSGNFVAISAGGYHSLALKSDGSIVGWGWNAYGQTTPPAGNDYIAIDAGGEHGLAIMAAKPKLGIVNKERIDRTRFVYNCDVTFTNLYSFAVKNVELQLMQASDNMTIIEPNVTFGDIEFGTRQSFTSTDTCTFIVDRAEAIDPDKIVWRVRCKRADSSMPIELTINGVASLGLERIAGDLTGDGGVDIEDLADLAEQWLWDGPAGSIPEDTIEDGIVNLADFAELAENWQGL